MQSGAAREDFPGDLEVDPKKYLERKAKEESMCRGW